MKTKLTSIFIFFVFMAAAFMVFAGTGTLTLEIVDSSGEPIAEAVVTISNGVYTDTTCTGANGEAVFNNVPFGTYSITITVRGCDPVSGGSVTLNPYTLNRRRAIALD